MFASRKSLARAIDIFHTKVDVKAIQVATELCGNTINCEQKRRYERCEELRTQHTRVLPTLVAESVLKIKVRMDMPLPDALALAALAEYK